MVLINYATKEIVAKIVYYGPGLCGKTTNLNYIYTRLNPKKRGKMISLATEEDRTLFFDFLPLELGIVQGFKIRFQLYTVPGQVFYDATRRLVLKGADAVVFVADSQEALLDKNVESLEDLKENLRTNGLDPDTIPIVIQYNKRDLDGVMDVADLDKVLNERGTSTFEAVAIDGPGVMETFKEITMLLLQELRRKHSMMDSDKIKDLPPEVFEPEKVTEPEEIEYELELGSGIQTGEDDEEVVAGELLDQIETISLADTVQAETFLDNVRKGDTPKEAAERAAAPHAVQPSEYAGDIKETLMTEEGGISFQEPEKEFSPEELMGEAHPVEEAAAPSPAQAAPTPPLSEAASFLETFSSGAGAALDEEVDETSMPVTTQEALGQTRARTAPEARTQAPSPPPGPGPDERVTEVLKALNRIEAELASLRESVDELMDRPDQAPAAAGPGASSAADMAGIKDELAKNAEGRDRLLLSILEASREIKQANNESHEKIEEALKYVVDKLMVDKKLGRKKWF